MKHSEFNKIRQQFQRKLERAKKAINKDYSKVANQFIKANSPVKVGKVYDVVGRKRRGLSERFVVFKISISAFSHATWINAWGWRLDHNGKCAKWESYTVFGNGRNDLALTLSENQVYVGPEVPKQKTIERV
jgi:hypothetical protein